MTKSTSPPTRLVAILAAALAAAPALAQVTIPFPPIAGLIERPADFQPIPRPKPTLRESFASECVAPHPELAWAALPKRLREVPLETMIGQLLVTSFTGDTPDDRGVADAERALARGEIGGIIHFRHNVSSAEDVKAINARLRAANPTLPAMIAVDQEGGAVTRIRPSEGAPDTPSARRMAERTPQEAAGHYGAMARTLAALGFTANFGPVVDLDLDPRNPVIARFGRSYGADAHTVVTYARAFVTAHREAGMATALKHFPGHGSAHGDTHDGAIDATDTWSRAELVPFARMIARGDADMIMLGHLAVHGLTGPHGTPASLSPRAVDGFLREILCFDGLVLSDDLAMDALASRFSLAEAAVGVVAAGGDIILLSLPAGGGSETLADIRESLLEEAERSRPFADRIRHAYARIVHHKLDLAEERSVASLPQASETRLADVR